MAIKNRKKISSYKVMRLITIIMFIMVVGLYCHNEYTEIPMRAISQEEALGEKSVEEMREKYNACLQEKADMELHQKLREEANKKSTAEQEAKLQAQQAKDKARSEKERTDFIEHRRDPHGPVTITQ